MYNNYLRRGYIFLTGAAILIGLSACGVTVGFQPDGLPIKIVVNWSSSSGLSVGVQNADDIEIAAEIGTFTASASLSASQYNNTLSDLGSRSTLIVRFNGQDRVFAFDGNDLHISFDQGYYKKIALDCAPIEQRQQCILVLDRIDPTPTIQSYTPSNAIPSDRSHAPYNSYWLGDFRVEQYCNDQGFGIVIINDYQDWACTDPNNRSVVKFVLTASNFDQICQATYRNAQAFAIQDQMKEYKVYDWTCYSF